MLQSSKFTFDFKIVTLRALAMKALVDREHLVLEREEFIPVHCRKSLAIVKRHHLPFAFTNVDIIDRFDGEVVAAEREDL